MIWKNTLDWHGNKAPVLMLLIVAKDGTNVLREENDVTINCWLILLLSKATQLCHCQVHFLISLCLAAHLITNNQFDSAKGLSTLGIRFHRPLGRHISFFFNIQDNHPADFRRVYKAS